MLTRQPHQPVSLLVSTGGLCMLTAGRAGCPRGLQQSNHDHVRHKPPPLACFSLSYVRLLVSLALVITLHYITYIRPASSKPSSRGSTPRTSSKPSSVARRQALLRGVEPRPRAAHRRSFGPRAHRAGRQHGHGVVLRLLRARAAGARGGGGGALGVVPVYYVV